MITLDEFKDAFKYEIRNNKKVKTMLKNIADEQRLVNKNTPALNFEEFKFIYLFLEWDYNKKKSIENKSKKVRRSKSEHTKSKKLDDL